MAWEVHGGWSDAFLRGNHEYLLPTPIERIGQGRAGTDWPAAREVAPESLHDRDVDLVVLQRLEEIEEAERLLGRRLGSEIPAIFVEHNTPRVDVPNSRHPLADRSDILIVHVTYFNQVMWDTGDAPHVVIEHGVPDPGLQYTGERRTLGVVINEPIRRWRVTGTDLLPAFTAAAPIDMFGMKTDDLPGVLGLGPESMRVIGDLPTATMHTRLAQARAYLHPFRWTSLGLSLIEAMHLGMPVLALNATEAARAVPPEAGAISSNPADLVRAAQHFVDDPDDARASGLVARQMALERYGLGQFLNRWDAVIGDATAHRSTRRFSLNRTE